MIAHPRERHVVLGGILPALKLNFAYWNYDRTHALTDGSVQIDGVDLTYRSDVIVSDIFERMLRNREFDVSELGLTFYLRTLDLDDPPFIAIPVFPNRFFRHSSVFVNKASGITSPQDLAGKTVGELLTYGHDAGIWAKGAISEDYGVTPDRCRWIIGGVDRPQQPHDFIAQPHPADVDVSAAAPGQALRADARIGRDRRPDFGNRSAMRAEVVAEGRAAVRRLRTRRARVFHAHGNLSDHAHRRHPKRRPRKTSRSGWRGLPWILRSKRLGREAIPGRERCFIRRRR